MTNTSNPNKLLSFEGRHLDELDAQELLLIAKDTMRENERLLKIIVDAKEALDRAFYGHYDEPASTEYPELYKNIETVLSNKHSDNDLKTFGGLTINAVERYDDEIRYNGKTIYTGNVKDFSSENIAEIVDKYLNDSGAKSPYWNLKEIRTKTRLNDES